MVKGGQGTGVEAIPGLQESLGSQLELLSLFAHSWATSDLTPGTQCGLVLRAPGREHRNQAGGLTYSSPGLFL